MAIPYTPSNGSTGGAIPYTPGQTPNVPAPAPQAPAKSGILGTLKSAVGGFASGVAGVALTAEDWAGRKLVNAFGSDKMKQNIANSPSLNQQFKTSFGGDTHPTAYGVGQFGGEIASLAAPVGATEKIVGAGAKALGAGKTVTKLAQGLTGGLTFTAGAGLQEGKMPTKSDFIQNGALGLAFPAAGSALKFVGDRAPARIINSLIKPLAKDFAYEKNPGKTIAELGIKANSWEDLMNKISQTKQKIGQSIGSVIEKSKNLNTIDLTKNLSPIDRAIQTAQKTPRTNAALINRLESVKADLTDNISKKINPQEFKGLVGDLTKWTGNASDDKAVNSALKQVYGSTRASMDSVLQKELSPKDFANYKKASEQYGGLMSAENATKHRSAVEQRQNLVSFGAKNVGLITAVGTAIATGGAAIAAMLAGAGGIAFDRAAATPAFKTRLASLLTKLAPNEVSTFFDKIPGVKSLFTPKEVSKLLNKVTDKLPSKR